MRQITTRLAAAAALILALSPLPAPTAALAGDMTFVITNSHPNALEVELYSQDRDHVWPGNGQVFLFDDGEEKTVPLSCEDGESICYGAWISGDPATYWGVGPDGTEECEDCCYVCNGGVTESIELVE
jgi:hypothetical protein